MAHFKLSPDDMAVIENCQHSDEGAEVTLFLDSEGINFTFYEDVTSHTVKLTFPSIREADNAYDVLWNKYKDSMGDFMTMVKYFNEIFVGV